MKRRRLLVMFIQIAAVMTISVGVVFATAHFWPDAGGAATCLKTHCFCEADSVGVISQPVNTLSSLAFVAAAAYAWLRMRDKRANRVFQGFIVSMLVIGLGSAYYHATLSFAGQWLDVAGMYLFGTLMICTTLLRAARVTKPQAVSIFVILNTVLATVQALAPDTRRYLFAILLVVALALEFALRRKSQEMKYLWCALGLMAAAYAIWLLDQFQLLCVPSSLAQGHALWHVLTAFAAFQIVRYYVDNTKEMS